MLAIASETIETWPERMMRTTLLPQFRQVGQVSGDGTRSPSA